MAAVTSSQVVPSKVNCRNELPNGVAFVDSCRQRHLSATREKLRSSRRSVSLELGGSGAQVAQDCDSPARNCSPERGLKHKGICAREKESLDESDRFLTCVLIALSAAAVCGAAVEPAESLPRNFESTGKRRRSYRPAPEAKPPAGVRRACAGQAQPEALPSAQAPAQGHQDQTQRSRPVNSQANDPRRPGRRRRLGRTTALASGLTAPAPMQPALTRAHVSPIRTATSCIRTRCSPAKFGEGTTIRVQAARPAFDGFDAKRASRSTARLPATC